MFSFGGMSFRRKLKIQTARVPEKMSTEVALRLATYCVAAWDLFVGTVCLISIVNELILRGSGFPIGDMMFLAPFEHKAKYDAMSALDDPYRAQYIVIGAMMGFAFMIVLSPFLWLGVRKDTTSYLQVWIVPNSIVLCIYSGVVLYLACTKDAMPYAMLGVLLPAAWWTKVWVVRNYETTIVRRKEFAAALKRKAISLEMRARDEAATAEPKIQPKGQQVLFIRPTTV